MSRTFKSLCALSATLLLLTACSAPRVELKYFNVDESMRTDCIALVQRLPGHVLDQGQREIVAYELDQSKLAAVWGDPVITLLCGVFAPLTLKPTSELVTVNEISWFPEETTNGYIFTSTNLRARVLVRVPADYAPETNVLADLSDALAPYLLTN